MSIQVNCSCGRSFSVRDELAGKKIYCPECNDPISVHGFGEQAGDTGDMDDMQHNDPVSPHHSDESNGTDSDIEERGRHIASKPPPWSRDPAGYRDDREWDFSEDGSARARSSGDDAELEFLAKRRAAEHSRGAGGSAGMSGGAVRGLVMMGIAVVWFVVGMYAGWLFYYPPILFVIGLITFFKGLASNRGE